MAHTGVASDRAAFAERLRLQLQARFASARVEVDAARHALQLRAPGVDVALPLTPLQHACDRDPAKAPALIAEFVRTAEARLAPGAVEPVSLSRLLWCVRSRRYLSQLARSDELLTAELGADLVAFVAESLPGAVMRGVPRADWEASAHDETAIRSAADANTRRRFLRLVDRVASIDRIPADGWRLAGDPLYQGSILMVPELLVEVVRRSASDILIGVPDRALVLMLPANQPGSGRFVQRVLREWREAMNPCSREVLVSDGTTFRTLPRGRSVAAMMPWLAD